MDHNQVPYPYSIVALVIGFSIGIIKSILVLTESLSPLSPDNIAQSVILSLICTATVFVANIALKWIQANYRKWTDKYYHLIWRRKKD